MSAPPPPERKFRFPPFPDVPEGVTITPFAQFQQSGICTTIGADGVERDALGIPTIELRSTSDAKTGDAGAGAPLPGLKVWWEEWDVAENTRTSEAAANRLQQAATDFTKSRRWPLPSTNLEHSWHQFRIYAGLLTPQPTLKKTAQMFNAGEADQDDGDGDPEGGQDDQDDLRAADQAPPQTCEMDRPSPHASSELSGTDAPQKKSQEQIQKLLEEARSRKDETLAHFLGDPARAIRLFLSSWMKYQGLCYYEPNLINTPRLLHFFVRYLRRNRVLPDKTSDRSLAKAMEIIDTALMELPLTSKVSRELRDAFSRACSTQWGSKEENLWDLLGHDRFEELSDAPNEVLSDEPNDGQALLTNEDIEVIAEEAAFDPSSFYPEADEDPHLAWADPLPPVMLESLVGAAGVGIASTHTAGMVERSMRRVRQILEPVQNVPPPSAPLDGPGPVPDDVERALEGRLWRVVLEPWPNWDGEESSDVLAEPETLRCSQEPLRLKHSFDGDITILVTAESAALLRVGMGVGGIWVQMARQGDFEEEDPTKKKKLTKAQKERLRLRYWYVEDVANVLPSYWLV
ncbi:unnamed protein product [Mycena citricolor]|uniref:Uncharacterized protein n=1 Tax=Mycena citricolor TaxID=2018698 RepID=A0AAD2HRF8_9AGAR|nr:unnamed protein product [Mycena citricolor]